MFAPLFRRHTAVIKRAFQDVSWEELQQLELVLKKIGKRAERLAEKFQPCSPEFRPATISPPSMARIEKLLALRPSRRTTFLRSPSRELTILWILRASGHSLIVSHALKFLSDHTPARQPDERPGVHSAADRRSTI